MSSSQTQIADCSFTFYTGPWLGLINQHNLLPRKRVGPLTALQSPQIMDGRFLAYKEFGAPKDRMVGSWLTKNLVPRKAQDPVCPWFFYSCRHGSAAITSHLSLDIVESRGVYIVSFDRPGHGQSDPNPEQTVKSISFDIEELVDQLGLASRFYMVGFSLGGGGQIVWTLDMPKVNSPQVFLHLVKSL